MLHVDLQELDEDVEGMQSTIYFLQQQLKEAKETIANLQQQNQTKVAEATSIDYGKSVIDDDDKMEEEEEELLQPDVTSDDRLELEGRLKSPNRQEQEEANIEDDVEKDDDDEEEEEEVSLRSNRRGRATPTKSATTPTKRGRATRGQKREVNVYGSSETKP